MKLNFYRIYAILLLGLITLVGIKCSPTSPKQNDQPNQTDKGMVVGVIFNNDGSFAQNAKVSVRKRSSLADTSGSMLKKLVGSDTATVTTNDSGKFVIDSIDTGTYVILSNLGTNSLSLNDSVSVKYKDSTITVPNDTLKPAGAIKGIIKLSEDGDPRKVFVLTFGVDKFAKVNLDGSFKISILAEGKYNLRFISSLDNYGILDTLNISVRSGDTTNLGTIEIPFSGIPTPKNLKISYDTLKQLVILTWDKSDSNLVKYFNIYRRNVDSNTLFIKLNTSQITDTIYSDSTGIPNNNYEYKITSVNNSDMEGNKSLGCTTAFTAVFKLIKTIGDQGTEDVKFIEITQIQKLRNGNLLVVDFGAHRVQIFDDSGKFISKWGSEGTGNGQFENPIAATVDDSGFIYIVEMSGVGRVQKFDTTGIFIKSWTVGTYCRGICFKNKKLFITSVGQSNSALGIKIIDLGTDSISFSNIPTISPFGICLDTKNGFIVADNEGNRLVSLDSAGGLIKSWNIPITAPTSIFSLDSEDMVFVCTSEKNAYAYKNNGPLITKIAIPEKPSSIVKSQPDYYYIATDNFIYKCLQLLPLRR